MSEEASGLSLLIVLAVAVLAPLLAAATGRIKVPAVALEVGLGILVGPHLLGYAQVTPLVDGLSRCGLAFLFFLAGFEVDLAKIRGRPAILAVAGWLLSLAIALGFGFLLRETGLVMSEMMVAVALTTTALGTLLPILRDSGELDTPFGADALAAGLVGECGPIVAISVAFATGGHSPPQTIALLVAFVVIALATASLALRVQPPRLVSILRRTMHTTAQLPVRLSFLLLTALFTLAREFALDAILGAMAAGMIVALLTSSEDGEILRERLESTGYGFFVPLFFIVSGMKFDLTALLASPEALARVPLFLALFLVTRGLPVLLYRGRMAGRDLAALAFVSATALPLVVVIAELGVARGQMRSETAAALVGAGMLSVLFYPFAAMTLRRTRNSAQAPVHQ